MEGYHRSVIRNACDWTHGQNNSMPGQGVLESFRAKLGFTVSATNTPGDITASGHRVNNRVNYECCGHPVGNEMAHIAD